MAYDIGRYYWAAAFMWALDSEGLFAVRLASAVFEAIGVSVAVFLCLVAWRRGGLLEWVLAIGAACVFVLWVRPYYKAYDHTTSVFIVLMSFVLLKSAKPSAWFGAGFCLGLAAVMGRHHGVYGALAALSVIVFLSYQTKSRRPLLSLVFWFLGGVIVGFSPNLLLSGFAEGFGVSFIESVISILSTGANIPLPVPWPWMIESEDIGLLLKVSERMVGFGFVALLLFPLLGGSVWARRGFDTESDTMKILVASMAAAIPYMHYAFSRADLTHLTMGIYPALIGLLSLVGRGGFPRIVICGGGMLLTSLVTFINANPFLSQHFIKPTFVDTVVDGERMWVAKGTYYRLQAVSQAVQNLAGSQTRFLAIPNMPGIHAIFRMKMPVWEIYSLYQRDRAFEEREIARLESSPPTFVFLSDHALDGVESYRYSNMHPLTYDWLRSRYHLVDQLALTKVDILMRHTPPVAPAELPLP